MLNLNSLSAFAQGYVWATILFPVEYYLLKPVVLRVYNDAIYYINPVLNKYRQYL